MRLERPSRDVDWTRRKFISGSLCKDGKISEGRTETSSPRG